MADQKSSLWKFVTYRDSMPEDWEEVAEEIGVPLCRSPWHDKDVDKVGEFKIPHLHWIASFDGPTTYKNALELFRPLGINIVKKVASRRRDERYLCHLDSPTKALYDIADVKTYGGYVIKFLEEQEILDGIAAIHELCESEGIIYYCDLANEVVEHFPEYLGTLLKYPAHFNNFCYSRERLAGKFDNVSYVKSRRKVGRYAGNV